MDCRKNFNKYFGGDCGFGERRVVWNEKMSGVDGVEVEGVQMNEDVNISKRERGLIRGVIKLARGAGKSVLDVMNSLFGSQNVHFAARRQFMRRGARVAAGVAGLAVMTSPLSRALAQEGTPEEDLNLEKLLTTKYHWQMLNSVSGTVSFAKAIKEFLTHEHFSAQNWISAMIHLGFATATHEKGPGYALSHVGVDLAYLAPVLVGTTLGDKLNDLRAGVGDVANFELREQESLVDGVQRLFDFAFDQAHIAALSSGAYAINMDADYRRLINASFFNNPMSNYRGALEGIRSAAEDDDTQTELSNFIELGFRNFERICQETLDPVKIDAAIDVLDTESTSLIAKFRDSEQLNDLEAASALERAMETLKLQMSKKYGNEDAKETWKAIEFSHQTIRSLANLLGQALAGDPPNILLMLDDDVSWGEKIEIQAVSLLSTLPLLTADCDKSVAMFGGRSGSIARKWGNEVLHNGKNLYTILYESYFGRLIGKFGNLEDAIKNRPEGRSKSAAAFDALFFGTARNVGKKIDVARNTLSHFGHGLAAVHWDNRSGGVARNDVGSVEQGAATTEIDNERLNARFIMRLLNDLPSDSVKSVLDSFNVDLDAFHDFVKAERKLLAEKDTKHFDWAASDLLDKLSGIGINPNLFRVRLAEKWLDKPTSDLAGLEKLYTKGAQGKVERLLDVCHEYIHTVKEEIGAGTEEVLALVMLQVVYLQSVMPSVYWTISQIMGDNVKVDPNTGEWLEGQDPMPKDVYHKVLASLVALCSVSAVADNLAMFMSCQKVLKKLSKSGLIDNSGYKFGTLVCYKAAIGFGAWTPAGGPASAPERDNPGNAFKQGWPTVLANAISCLPQMYTILGIDIDKGWTRQMLAMPIMARIIQGILGTVGDKVSDRSSEAANDDKEGHGRISRIVSRTADLVTPVDFISKKIIGDSPGNMMERRREEMVGAFENLGKALSV